ncbi:7325_t:CDS:10, partial [Dentiscutata heterogama]
NVPFTPSYLALDISVIANINPETGFLVANIDPTAGLKWAKYTSPLKLTNNSTISKISEGNIPFPSNAMAYSYQSNFNAFTLFQKVDGSYGLAYCLAYTMNYTSHFNYNFTDINPYITVNVAFISNTNTSESTGPFLIYTTKNVSNIIFLDSCQSRYDSRGIDCLISELTARTPNLPAPGVMKISFLSTGAVMNITPVPITTTQTSSNITFYKYFSLHYGGALFVKYSVIANESFEILGYYSNDSLTSFKLWDIPENLTITVASNVIAHLSSGLMQNNTFWLAIKDINQNWVIMNSDMPRYLKDVGFQNVLITSSYPGINQKLYLRFKNSLNITYRNPISQSSGNISIYRIFNNDTKQLQLRQSFSGLSYCSILSDNTTISCLILLSTFNVPSAFYMITVDNEFVQDAGLQEKIRGIANGLWTVQTESRDLSYIYSEPITGTLRLTEDGTIHYNNLTSDQKSLFIMSLRDELAQCIPTDSSRILFSGRTNIDLNTPGQQLLFELTISDTKDLFQPNADQIKDDLNSLIENKYITALSTLPHTSYIDDNHQFESLPNLWEEFLDHKYWAIGVGIVSIFLIIIYLLARKRHNKIKPEKKCLHLKFSPSLGCSHKPKCLLRDDCKNLQNDYYTKNFPAKQCRASVLFTSSLSLFHLFLNILFIIENAKDVPDLYIPSADIEILLVLNSHLGGFEIFNAPFTKKATSYIFWCKVLTIFIDSIPWLIIQVFYHVKIITYQIIPFINLVISCISLFIYILIKVYRCFYDCRSSNKELDKEKEIINEDNKVQRINGEDNKDEEINNEDVKNEEINIENEEEKNNDENKEIIINSTRRRIYTKDINADQILSASRKVSDFSIFTSSTELHPPQIPVILFLFFFL